MRLGPLRHPWFAAFSGSVGLGGLGDEVARLALPLLILDLTHSIAAAAALRLVQALPYVFFGGILGVLIDRADKRKLLIACDALSVALTLTIPISVAVGVFSLNLLYFIGFLLGTVEVAWGDRKSTRLNSSHTVISYAVFCLKKKKKKKPSAESVISF